MDKPQGELAMYQHADMYNNRPFSYCVMDDVIVSIATAITELYGQLSGKRVVATLYYKSSEELKFGVWKNICSLTRYMLFMILEFPSQISPCRW